MAWVSRQAQLPRGYKFWLMLPLVLFAIKLPLIMFVFPDHPLVPDEGLYVVLLEAVIRGDDIVETGNKLGYGALIFTGSWVLLRPAQVMAGLGLSPLESLRVTSLVLGTLAVLLVLAIALRARRNTVRPGSVPGAALLAILLLPSFQLWGLLGLRDASVVFCMVLVAWGFSLLATPSAGPSNVLGSIALFLGTMGMYSARSYLSLLLSGAALLAIALPPYRGRGLVIGFVVCALVAGNYAGRAVTEIQAGQAVTASVRAELSTSTQESASTTDGTTWRPSPPLAAINSRVNTFSETRAGMRIGAGSAYAWNYCTSEDDVLPIFVCEATFLPIGIHRYLLSPNLIETGLDIPRQRLLAGLENIVWLLIILAALGSVVARRSLSPRMTVFLITLLVVTTLAYALVSGNEGTAFRHKGQFLWAWCLVIALGYGRRSWLSSLVRRNRPLLRQR